ncbi:MAG TPA: translocation/assembly module TamB domain-containing protein, partial [Polyangiales bacterium]|nr:translocation/assembly module TamB domain-containing protein [Polyangiales bacterium]
TPGFAPSCECAITPELEATAALGGGALHFTLSGSSAQRRVLTAETTLRAPLARFLRGDQPVLPSQISARFEQLGLSGLPYLCEHAQGEVTGTIRATDLFQRSAQVNVRLRGTGLRWEDNPALDASLTAEIERSGLAVHAKLRPGAGRASIEAQLPLRLTDPALQFERTDPLSVQVQLERASMGALLAFVPGVARASGTIHGYVKLDGTFQRPVTHGEFVLRNVSFTLPTAGQRFSEIDGRVRLSGRTLYLTNTLVRELGGTARVSGQLELQSLQAWQASLAVSARNFPVRRGGVLLGRVDTDVRAEVQSSAQKLAVDLSLHDTSVSLTGDTGADVQSLEPNPDIVFASELRAKARRTPRTRAPDANARPAILRVRTREPAWVRRTDFAVQLSADASITLGTSASPSLRGSVELRRGYISLLGQSFDIREGRVTFTGGEDIDPQLQITATQTTSSGEVVRVEVSGFVHKPELAFFVDDQAVTAGDAVVALTGGGSAAGGGGSTLEAAEQQLTAAAIGMTTGLLSVAARQEFGDWIPRLSIEQGEQTRVRIGFNADQLIPEFLEGFVRGAYVEGVVTTDPDEPTANVATGTRTVPGGGGVLLELMLPADLVWAGQYGPGNTWSVDLDWRP